MSINTQSHALLLFRVGPVLCCAPSMPIEAMIEPRPMTRTPGSSDAQPGMFRHAGHIVSAVDLRIRFGVEHAAQTQPGRVIITRLGADHIGFHVDEIIEVIEMPAGGWGALPALLPRGVFTRTLLWRDQIWLYAEFDKLQTITGNAYLRQYLQQLQQASPARTVPTDTADSIANSTTRTTSSTATPTVTQATPAASTTPGRPDMTRSDPVVQARQALPREQRNSPVATPIQSPRQAPALARARQAVRDKPQQGSGPASVAVTPPQTSRPAARQIPPNKKPRKPAPRATAWHATATPPARLTPHTPAPATDTTTHTAGAFGVLLLFVLLLAGIGLGTWYLVSPTHTKPDSQPAAPITFAPELREFTVSTGTSGEPPPATVEDIASPPPAQHMNEVPPVATVAADATIEGENSHGELQASIERDAEGITITVEVPEDDPIFQPDAMPATGSINESVSITSDTGTNEQPGNTGDVQQTTGVAAGTPPASSTTPPASTANIDSVEIMHIVVRGDTLWHIAKRYVDNPYRYPELARLSNIRNPDLIYPGDRVRILKRKRKKAP